MFAFFSSRIATAAVAGLLAAGIAAPAAAAGKPKPVTLPASVFKSEDSKLCMANPAERNAKTECLTRGEWESRGVTFNLK